MAGYRARVMLLSLKVIALFMGLLWAFPADAYRPKILRIGFIPSENGHQMYLKVTPLVKALSTAMGMRVAPFIATDYPGVIEAMRSQKLDAAFLAPLAYVIAEKKAEARLLLKVVRHGSDVFYSAIIVRKDSGIRGLKELKGKTFAFGDPLSMAGTIFPQMLLRESGVDPLKDLVRLAPAGHDVTVFNVFNKEAAAGAVFANDPIGKEGAWSLFLKTPEDRAQIVPIAMSKAIPNDTFCVRRDLDEAVAQKLQKAILGLSRTPTGRALFYDIYHIDGFKPAKPADYDSVRQAVKALGRTY